MGGQSSWCKWKIAWICTNKMRTMGNSISNEVLLRLLDQSWSSDRDRLSSNTRNDEVLLSNKPGDA
jgi:hypothetical protein